MLSHRTLRARALARPDVKAEFDRLKPEFAFLDQVLAARKAAGDDDGGSSKWWNRREYMPPRATRVAAKPRG